MDAVDFPLRERITSAVWRVLEPLPAVHAGWESGSAAFGTVDAYSDIDLNFIVDDECSLDSLYAASEHALEEISPISINHVVPPGRYYKLAAGGEFLFVDLCFFRAGHSDHPLEVERHGIPRRLFDKADWLRAKPLDEQILASRRDLRRRELQDWFVASQSFVRKAILRERQVEALASFWSYTLRPLAELLRMRYCPARWDFGGMRYLDRDLPAAVYEEFKALAFVRDTQELAGKLASAEEWGSRLLRELDPRGQVAALGPGAAG
jgi:hypothetical protein